MNIDTLLRDADPVVDIIVPTADVLDARRICEPLTKTYSTVSGPTHKRRVPVALALAAVTVSVVIVEVLPGSPGAPTSAAAAVLTRAASAARNGPAIELGSGQFLYTETRTLQVVDTSLGDDDSGGAFAVSYDETKQTWQAANGSGREIDTYNGPPQFSSPGSQADWAAAGRPSIAPEVNTPGGQLDTTFGPSQSGSVSSTDGTEPGPALVDDSNLSTDPDALGRVIQKGGLIGQNEQVNVQDPSTPAGTFESALGILETPAVGRSSALRSALFQVMANVPGVQLLGPAVDRMGRSGTEIASPINNNFGDRFEILIDPVTGAVLQSKDVLVDPSRVPADDVTYVGDEKGEVIGWTDYLQTGVVNTITAVVGGRTA